MRLRLRLVLHHGVPGNPRAEHPQGHAACLSLGRHCLVSIYLRKKEKTVKNDKAKKKYGGERKERLTHNSISSFLAGYDSGVAGGVLTYKSFEADFKFKSSTESEVSSLTIGLEQLGSFLSCFFVYPLTNKYGRKYVIAASSLVFVIGAVIQTIKTGSLAGWYVGRIVAGIGMGGLSIVVPMYTAEMTPKEIRGRCGSFYQWMYTWGVFAAYWIDYVGHLPHRIPRPSF